MIRAVLFDLDGTLHDRAATIDAFARDQFYRLGTNEKEVERYINRFVELDGNGMVWKSQVYSQLIKEFKLKNRPAVETLVAEYIQLYPNFAIPMEDANYVLETLKKQKMMVGILTNGRTELQRSVITALGFNTLVDTIVISEEVGFRKPQQEIFEIALNQLGAQANETVHIGDDAIADMEGAMGAGIRPFAFKHEKSLNGIVSIASLKEVLPAISV
jgi:putative hydrolase of the HAD superfamily